MNRRGAVIVAGVVLALVAVALVIARRDTGHTPSTLPIALGSSAASGGADAALAPYGVLVYHLGANVPTLDGTSRAYRLTSEDPTAAARRLAGVFGVHGEPTVDGDTVTVTDGAAQLTVSPHAWSYSSNPNGSVSSPPATQPPLTDVLPTEDEAKKTAGDLLARAGVDTNGAAVTTDLGANEWFVRVDPTVDGVATEGLGATVVIGAKAVIDSAGGSLGTATPADEYPLVGTKVAVDRLNAGEGTVGPQQLEAQDQPALTTGGADIVSGSDEPPATDDAVSGGEASAAPPSPPDSASASPPDSASASPPDSASASPPDREPPITGTIPPPEPQDVTLTGAERILLFVTSSNGREGWLVPAYRFSTADGTGPTVIAVADRFLLAADVPPTGR